MLHFHNTPNFLKDAIHFTDSLMQKPEQLVHVVHTASKQRTLHCLFRVGRQIFARLNPVL